MATWTLPKDLFYQAAELLAAAQEADRRGDGVKLQHYEEQLRRMPGYPLATGPEDTIVLEERNTSSIIDLGRLQ